MHHREFKRVRLGWGGGGCGLVGDISFSQKNISSIQLFFFFFFHKQNSLFVEEITNVAVSKQVNSVNFYIPYRSCSGLLNVYLKFHKILFTG